MPHDIMRLEECPRVRATRYLLSPTHNGFGNQYMCVEKALLLAIALNRTLVLPPLLKHEEFNYYPQCNGKKVHTEAFSLKAISEYKKVLAKNQTRRWTELFDFSLVQRAGVSVIDFVDVDNLNYMSVPRLSCNAPRSRDDIKVLVPDDIKAVVIGSSFRMKLERIRKELQVNRCGWQLLSAAHALPFQPIVTNAAKTIITNRLVNYKEFDAVHLRSGDKSDLNAETVVAAVVHKIEPQLRQSFTHTKKVIYVAYDLDASFRHFVAFLDAVCGINCGRPLGHANLLLPIDLPPHPTNKTPSMLGHQEHDHNEMKRRKVIYRARTSLMHAFGEELAEIALDLEIAAHAQSLHLSDGARHTYRRVSSFGRILKRRWLQYQQAAISRRLVPN